MVEPKVAVDKRLSQSLLRLTEIGQISIDLGYISF
ncbi:hypothetical protein KR49_13940 [Synechococcus sp. KORDI-49]|nr:hypothetical protein KR49_13940 [Synechococcus sp. KORDI-49]